MDVVFSVCIVIYDTRVYSCINDIEKCDMFLIPKNLIMYHLMVL